MSEQGGWVEFVDEPLRATVRRRLTFFSIAMVVVGPVVGFLPPKGGGEPLSHTFPWWVIIVGGLVFGGVVAGIAWLWARYVFAPFAVDAQAKVIRIHGRSRPYAEITRASVEDLDNNGQTLALRLGAGQRNLSNGPQGAPGRPSTFGSLAAGGRAQALVLVRDRRGAVLEPAQKDVLVDVIRGSSISRASDPYDPTGKFAKYNHPYTLDKADAEAFVTSPPAPGEPRPWGE